MKHSGPCEAVGDMFYPVKRPPRRCKSAGAVVHSLMAVTSWKLVLIAGIMIL